MKRKIKVRIVAKAKNAILAEFADSCGSVILAAQRIGVAPGTYSNWLNFRTAPRGNGSGMKRETLKHVIISLERETGKNATEIFSMTKKEMGLFRDARVTTKEIEPERLLEYARSRELTYEPDSKPEIDELRESMKKALGSLSYREREIIKLRYGIGGDGYAYTLEEVARIFKVGRERIRQIEEKAIRKLQQPSRSSELVGHLD